MSTPSLSPDPSATADAVEQAALGVEHVVGLHGGAFGEVATYLPGRRVTGIRLQDDQTEVHVVVDGEDLLATAEAVRAAVLRIVGAPVDVYIEDLA